MDTHLSDLGLPEALAARQHAVLNLLQDYQQRQCRMMLTSSFQTHSIPLLHIVSLLPVPINVYFIDTGYLFPETYCFRDQVAQTLGLTVKVLRSSLSKRQQVTSEQQLLYAVNPDRCCHINKVQPVMEVLSGYDIWISGLRRAQSAHRQQLTLEQQLPQGVMRLHPLLDWSDVDVADYRNHYGLPAHPLDSQGYHSIGCMPCTTSPQAAGDRRSGRWQGMKKTECGLHTTLLGKKSGCPSGVE